MTANSNTELFNTSDGLVAKNVKRNDIGSREQFSLQATLEGGGHDDASYHPRKSVQGVRPSDGERALAKASE